MVRSHPLGFAHGVVGEAWTKSEASRAAHSRVGDNKPLYHSEFEELQVARRPDAARQTRRDLRLQSSTENFVDAR
jgi:hypothetical protein